MDNARLRMEVTASGYHAHVARIELRKAANATDQEEREKALFASECAMNTAIRALAETANLIGLAYAVEIADCPECHCFKGVYSVGDHVDGTSYMCVDCGFVGDPSSFMHE